MGTSKDSPSDINQQDLHALYNDETRAEHAVYMDGARKALGLGKSGGKPMEVRTDTRTGMGWKELAVIGATMIGGGALVATFLGDKAPPPAATSPADSEYEVRFFDADGNPIAVPHISERPKP